VSPEEPDAVSRLDDLTGEDKRHMLRPSELKQMELKKYTEQCSEIVPKQIYISSFTVANDLALLQRNEVTHILNLAADICENRFPDKFIYATYYVKDSSGEDISMLFYRTLEWIQAALHAGGRVLVHCKEGVSRSATMVIAYLMWTNHLSFKEAHEIVRRVRPICNPNPGFTFHLLELGKKLGTGTPGRPIGGPQVLLSRVRPHHPKNPFLLLEPQKPQPPPLFDPRFGWVVRCDKQLVLWLGSQVPDVEAVQATVLQHAQFFETFEKNKYNVTIVQEGQETPVLWQALGLPAVQKGKPAPALAAVRPAFDADYEVTRAIAGRPV
jgi:protein-tyrosine phosphatase